MARFKRCALMAVLIGVCLCTSVSAQNKLTADQAKEHFGQAATVCGEVVSTSYADSSNGHPTFLNLDKRYPHQIFTVVIWGENRTKFGKPEEDYKGKRICVSGKITAYAGKPEMVVSDPKQIKVE
jgi:DNA/RNA endonuclease YhcR with UshA esterase domain